MTDQTRIAGQVLANTLDFVLSDMDRLFKSLPEMPSKEAAEPEAEGPKEAPSHRYEEEFVNLRQILLSLRERFFEEGALSLNYPEAEVYGAVLGVVLDCLRDRLRDLRKMEDTDYRFVAEMMVWSYEKIATLMKDIKLFLSDARNRVEHKTFWVEADPSLLAILSKRRPPHEPAAQDDTPKGH